MTVLLTPVFNILLCLPPCVLPLPVQQTPSEALDETVSLQRGEDDVHEPQAEKEGGGEDLWDSWASQLTPDLRPTSVHEHSYGDEGKYGEECDRKGQCSRIHFEGFAFCCMVNGSYGPRNTNAQEDIDSIAPSDIPNGGVCILVLNCSDFTGKSICQRREREGLVKVKDWE